MRGQTPDPSLRVSVDHGVGGSILLPYLDDLSIFGSHQYFTLKFPEGKKKKPDGYITIIITNVFIIVFLM